MTEAVLSKQVIQHTVK